MSHPRTPASNADESGYRLLRETAGRFEPAWGLIELTGEDRMEWLQGQQTHDLRDLGVGGSLAMCFCTPTGQLLTMATLWVFEDRCLLGVPNAGIPAVLKRCEQMVILEDVVARDLTDDHRTVSVQGPEANERLAELFDLPPHDAGSARFEDTDVGCLRHDRTGLGGWDMVLPVGSSRGCRALADAFPTVGEATVDMARLEAGLPQLGIDTDARTLPPELGPNFEARTISYRKGCYTGQEVLMRLHSRGHTNRTWMALLCAAPVAPGASVGSPRRADAGKVTSAAVSPRFGPIAGAMLRNEAAVEGDEVEVQGPEGPVRAEVRAMPLLG